MSAALIGVASATSNTILLAPEVTVREGIHERRNIRVLLKFFGRNSVIAPLAFFLARVGATVRTFFECLPRSVLAIAPFVLAFHRLVIILLVFFLQFLLPLFLLLHQLLLVSRSQGAGILAVLRFWRFSAFGLSCKSQIQFGQFEINVDARNLRQCDVGKCDVGECNVGKFDVPECDVQLRHAHIDVESGAAVSIGKPLFAMTVPLLHAETQASILVAVIWAQGCRTGGATPARQTLAFLVEAQAVSGTATLKCVCWVAVATLP